MGSLEELGVELSLTELDDARLSELELYASEESELELYGIDDSELEAGGSECELQLDSLQELADSDDDGSEGEYELLLELEYESDGMRSLVELDEYGIGAFLKNE